MAHHVFDLPDLGISASRRLFNHVRESWHASLLQISSGSCQPEVPLFSKNNFKDDLVQLNGYYAYEPKLSCKLEFAANANLTPVWKSLRQVVEGNSVQKTLTGTELAKALGIGESQLKNILLEIRALGYEIRSAATNPQIPEDSFLIPYAFPTFTHRSVQFHKELF